MINKTIFVNFANFKQTLMSKIRVIINSLFANTNRSDINSFILFEKLRYLIINYQSKRRPKTLEVYLTESYGFDI